MALFQILVVLFTFLVSPRLFKYTVAYMLGYFHVSNPIARIIDFVLWFLLIYTPTEMLNHMYRLSWDAYVKYQIPSDGPNSTEDANFEDPDMSTL